MGNPSKEIFEYLQENKVVIVKTDLGWSILSSLANKNLIEQTNSSPNLFPHLLVADEAMLQQYVNEVPEQGWDLLDFTDTSLALILEDTKNIPDEALTEKMGCFRILADCPPVFNALKRHRKPAWCANFIDAKKQPIQEKSQIPNEYLAIADYIVDLQPSNNGTRSYSVIKIRLNGEIEIVKK